MSYKIKLTEMKTFLKSLSSPYLFNTEWHEDEYSLPSTLFVYTERTHTDK